MHVPADIQNNVGGKRIICSLRALDKADFIMYTLSKIVPIMGGRKVMRKCL